MRQSRLAIKKISSRYTYKNKPNNNKEMEFIPINGTKNVTAWTSTLVKSPNTCTNWGNMTGSAPLSP